MGLSIKSLYKGYDETKTVHTDLQSDEDENRRNGFVPDKATTAGHNGDICPRSSTQYGAEPNAEIV